MKAGDNCTGTARRDEGSVQLAHYPARQATAVMIFPILIMKCFGELQAGGQMIEAAGRPDLRSLTGLRFIAAIVVVLYHTSVQLLPEMKPAVSMGQTGVAFFFALSGFILAWSQNLATPKRVFYWRRFCRIWPLHFVTTILAVALVAASHAELSVAKLLAVLLLVQAWSPDGHWSFALNGPSWSLSCEMFFYAIFPFLAGFLQRRSIKVVLLVAGGTLCIAVVGIVSTCYLFLS